MTPAALTVFVLAIGISFETVALVALAAGLGYCVSAIADLRRRLDARPTAAPPPAPVAASAVAAPSPAPVKSELPSVPPAPAPVATAVVPERFPPALRAAIIAAVHYVLGPQHRIAAIVPLPPVGNPAWSLEGRREVFHSHHTR